MKCRSKDCDNFDKEDIDNFDCSSYERVSSCKIYNRLLPLWAFQDRFEDETVSGHTYEFFKIRDEYVYGILTHRLTESPLCHIWFLDSGRSYYGGDYNLVQKKSETEDKPKLPDKIFNLTILDKDEFIAENIVKIAYGMNQIIEYLKNKEE